MASHPLDRIEIVQGDITQQRVDAIVNAANSSLRGGGGVDGAIHRAAGPRLLEECCTLGGCPTGEARITRGYNLPARWVIHTVGPVWRGGNKGEPELLAACYRNSLALAADPVYEIRTVAYPSISTGAYGYPLDRAARVALAEISRCLPDHPGIVRVTLVGFGHQAVQAYSRALADLRG
jgi:O-acetyl-ADP-ribose deacetylase (regulator of RNase III)